MHEDNRALNWALSLEGATGPTDKLVLVVLASWLTERVETDIVFPGREQLAEACCCSIDTVQRSLKRLIAAGHLSTIKTTEAGKRNYDRIRINYN